MTLSFKAHCYLIGVTLCWGLTFPLIKNAIIFITPNTFVIARYTLAAVALLPLIWPARHRLTRRLLGSGLILGTLNAGVALFQTIGLETTSSANSAFLTAVSIVLIPFLMPFFKLGKPHVVHVLCSLLALFGIYWLTGAGFQHITQGDVWTLGCAVLSANTIVYLQCVAKKTHAYLLLSFLQIVFVLPVPLILAQQHAAFSFLHTDVLIGIGFCAIFGSCLASYWQCKWQPHTSPAHAALIYALEPIFATLFAYLINGEPVTHDIFIGGSMIVLALLLSEFSPRWMKHG